MAKTVFAGAGMMGTGRGITIGAALIGIFVVANTVPGAASAQTLPTSRADRVQWLQQHAAPIRSTDPADEDFSDLAPLGAAIGKSRIVMLGEQSHGDGTTFLAKTRIIKYLHEKLGFDVLAFESGFYDMPKAWSFLKGGEDAATAVGRGVPIIWTWSAQFQPLIDYLGQQAKSAHPLELTGFDNPFTGSASGRLLREDLRAFLTGHGIDTTSMRNWTHASQLLDDLLSTSWSSKKPTNQQFAQYMAGWTELRARVDRLAASDTTVAYWQQLLKSTSELAIQVFEYNDVDPAAKRSTRDIQMGDNLLWLARKKFPDRKIIVWAHTFHVIRNNDVIDRGGEDPRYRNLITMGHVVSGTLHDEVYAIGFISSEGTAGLPPESPHPVPIPSPESLEGMFASTSRDNAFIDFRGLSGDGRWLQQPIVSAVVGYEAYIANWTRVLDGMVYIRRMTPSTLPPRPPPVAPTYTAEERTEAACRDAATLGCGLGLEQFALIPAGTFEMGSDSGPPNELPKHRVTISRPFLLQKTEVTQAQWRAVTDTNPSVHSTCGDACPVDRVSWDDIQVFLRTLNAKTNGVTYRLPTEAEWEYAARAGTAGDSYGALSEIAWYDINSDQKSHPVARKLPNAWGLYDMLGNLLEWVNDSFDDYATVPVTDPAGPATGTGRVFRGTGYNMTQANQRAGRRGVTRPGVATGGRGFRLVRIQ